MLSSQSEFPFRVYTDGSCDFRDGIMGYAALTEGPTTNGMVSRCGAETGGSVRRAEMQGFLLGLQTVLELSELHDPKQRTLFFQTGLPRLAVHWFTDRSDLALSVSSPTGGRLYSRAQDADLWHRIGWYEMMFAITATNIPRNSMPAQETADRVAGLTRKAMQAFVRDEAARGHHLNQ